MALMDKKRHRGKRYEERRVVRRRTFKKRRRTGLFVFLGLIVLTVGAAIFFGTDLTSSRTDGESVGQVADPTVDGAPEIVSEEDAAGDEAADDESADEE